MVGNTLLEWGTEEQKRHFLPRILTGEDIWCQGYSEPNAGSDLGNLGCRAVLDGDEWVINGQKIWTSAGHLANWIFVLTRTDPDAPKHKGITFLLVPDGPARRRGAPDQDDLRRLASSTRCSSPTPACPKENVIGEVNGGWAVAMTLLGYERGEAAATVPDHVPHRARPARSRWPRSAARPTTRSSASGWRGATRKVEIMRYLGLRTLTQFLARRTSPAPRRRSSSSTGASTTSEVTELAVDILGADALVPDGPPAVVVVPDRRRRARPTTAASLGRHVPATPGPARSTPAPSQIQRNIIGEMVLGLPKEPKADGGTLGASQQAAKSWSRRRGRSGDPGCGGRRRGPHPSLWLTGAARQARRLARPGLVAPAAVPARCPPRPTSASGWRRVRRRRTTRPTPDDLVTYLALVPALTGRRAARPSAPECRAASTGNVGPAMSRALVLNATYEPLCVVPGRRAVVLVLARQGRRRSTTPARRCTPST